MAGSIHHGLVYLVDRVTSAQAQCEGRACSRWHLRDQAESPRHLHREQARSTKTIDTCAPFSGAKTAK